MAADAPASVPATRVRSAASTTNRQPAYPAGHLGHLGAAEADALDRFKAALVDRRLWASGPPASHDDATLLRFLRARRWVVDACRQFGDTEAWRAANNLDTLYRTVALDAYEQSRRLYPQWTGRRDRRGIPVYLFDIRSLDARSLADYERRGGRSTLSAAPPPPAGSKTPPGLLRLFALYENLTCFAQPLCTQLPDREHPDVPITMSTNIVDISGVGLKQFWNLKSHMQAASQLATAHYPETLDRIFIVGAPAFFSTVWAWVKRWFDPITVSKIFVLAPTEVGATLDEFIEPRNIPAKYGGSLDFSFGQLPVADTAWDGVIRWEPGFSSFPTGPLLWEDADDGRRLACVAYGTHADGTPRRQTVCTVPRTWPPADEADDDGAAPNTNTASSMTATAATDASEATQTPAEPVENQADGVKADDAVAIDDAVGELRLSEEKQRLAEAEAATANDAPPAAPAAVA